MIAGKLEIKDVDSGERKCEDGGRVGSFDASVLAISMESLIRDWTLSLEMIMQLVATGEDRLRLSGSSGHERSMRTDW